MKNIGRRIILDLLGVSFLIIGVLGLFLPILNGIIFLFIGLYLLSINSKWFRDKLDKYLRSHEKLGKFIEAIESRIKKVLESIGLTDKL